MAEISKKRGRPLGSTKEKIEAAKNRSGVFVTKFEKQIQNTPITKDSSMGWRKWGIDNLYCNKLLNLYSSSPTHHSACQFAIASILGNGVDFEAMGLNGDEVVPNKTQVWDDVIRGLATDYILYGSYALQVLKNRDNKTYSFFNVGLDKVRWGEYDESGNIPYYYISADWSALGTNPPIRIDALDLSNDENLKMGVPYLYVYRAYTPTQQYYTQPTYAAAIQAIQSEIEFVQHDLKSATNNFVPSGMLVLNDAETQEERQAIMNNIQNMFIGSSNSNSLMVTFRNNIEENKPEFVPFTANNGNVNIYADANNRTINRILCAHQIPNASLIGMPDLNNSGFSSEAQKLEVSYQLYNKLTGNYNRMAVIRTLNQMFKLNGIQTEIIMRPLSFDDFGNDADVKERTEADTITEEDKKQQTDEKVVE